MPITVFIDIPEAQFEDAVTFWSAVTGCAVSRPPEDRSQLVSLVPSVGRPRVRLQAVCDEGGVHLDVDSTDRPGGAAARPVGADAVLDQVCLDIPAPLFEREVASWQALTGRTLERGRLPEFAFLGPGDDDVVRILLQRLDETAGVVRAHVDLAVADRAAETVRQVGLGGEVVREHTHWTVLRAPGGHEYCLTDRDPTTGNVRG